MSEHLGFYLSDASRLMRKRFDLASRSSGVTGSQWRVLINVGRSPGINQGQLADLLEVEPITTCRMVDRLEQLGLLERRRDPKDRRVWQIFLTDAAQPLIERLKTVGDSIREQSTLGFSDQESATLLSLLDRLRDNLLDDRAWQMESAENG